MTRHRIPSAGKAAWARKMAADRLKQAGNLPDHGGNWRRRKAIEATRAALLAEAARFSNLAERHATEAVATPF